MAQGKKSFILYSDLKHTVEKLTDDKAGALFKHILQYVNDEDPQTDDILVQLVFEPIRQQLKRDLKEWEETKSNKSIAGRLGNLKRWSPEIYKKVIDKQLSIEQAEEIAHRTTSHSDNCDRTTSQNIANIAVNVNDNVNVNVNDNGIKEEEGENKFSRTLTPEPEDILKPEKEKKNKYAENVTMTNSEHEKLVQEFGAADTDELVEILNNYKGANGKKYKSDYLAIRNWVVDKLKEKRLKEIKNGNNQRFGNTPTTTDEEFLTAIANGMARGYKQRNDRLQGQFNPEGGSY